MYGYNTFPIDNANESASDLMAFAKKVLKVIKDAGVVIKDFMSKIYNKIRTIVAPKEKVISASMDGVILIDDIKNGVVSLIEACHLHIRKLRNLYIDFNNGTNEFKRDKTGNTSIRSMTTTGGLDILPTDINISVDDYRKWNEYKSEFAILFKEHATVATDLKHKLQEFLLMPVSYDVLKSGYTAFKEIFNENGKFGNTWKTIIVASDWATGDIRLHLSKVVRLYQSGILITNVLGKKLTAKMVRDSEGNLIDNPNELNSKLFGQNKVNKLHMMNKNDATKNFDTSVDRYFDDDTDIFGKSFGSFDYSGES